MAENPLAGLPTDIAAEFQRQIDRLPHHPSINQGTTNIVNPRLAEVAERTFTDIMDDIGHYTGGPVERGDSLTIGEILTGEPGNVGIMEDYTRIPEPGFTSEPGAIGVSGFNDPLMPSPSNVERDFAGMNLNIPLTDTFTSLSEKYLEFHRRRDRENRTTSESPLRGYHLINEFRLRGKSVLTIGVEVPNEIFEEKKLDTSTSLHYWIVSKRWARIFYSKDFVRDFWDSILNVFEVTAKRTYLNENNRVTSMNRTLLQELEKKNIAIGYIKQ